MRRLLFVLMLAALVVPLTPCDQPQGVVWAAKEKKPKPPKPKPPKPPKPDPGPLPPPPPPPPPLPPIPEGRGPRQAPGVDPDYVPPAGVLIPVGTNINTVAAANPPGTVLILAAGTHQPTYAIRLKTNQQLHGQPGAKCLGTSAATKIFTGLESVTGLKIVNIEFAGYGATGYAIDGGAAPWGELSQCEIRDLGNNANAVRVGTALRRCKIHHVGVCFATWDINNALDTSQPQMNPAVQIIEDCEFWACELLCKCWSSDGVIVRFCHGHDTIWVPGKGDSGCGLWFDHNNINIVCHNNLLERINGHAIFHEVSYRGDYYANTCRDVFANQFWQSAGIAITRSMDVRVFDNDVSRCANGIILYEERKGQRYRADLVPNRAEWETLRFRGTQNRVSDCGVLAGSVSFGGSATDPADDNRFDENTHSLPQTTAPFRWPGQMTFSQWQAAGQDTRGTLLP